MTAETAVNAAVGLGGTALALIAPQTAAIFAGVATGCWMFWQLACSIYDRAKARRRENDN